MNRKSYVRIIKALVDLLIVIMVEAGRVPFENAARIGTSIMKAVTGGTGENDV